MTTADKADLLGELIGYEGCELGGFWGDLIEMYSYSKDYMSEEFWLQMGLEIEIQFEDAVNFVMEDQIDVEDENLMKRIKDYLNE
ncbi:MAG: hypothetical protein QN632_08625 [Nitrososphaeraceae archaeon]|nr:hypothetical protein [Nitrososphaeraceae archaeon]